MNEESFVRTLIERTGGDRSPIGDDCAVIEQFTPPLLLTTDVLNNQVHYDDGFSPAQIGHKASAVNVSDIHAMGGEPRWGLCSLSTVTDKNRSDEILNGVLNGLNVVGAELVGGDLSSVQRPSSESICVSLVGEAHPDGILRRNTASPGDRIAVSGPLGASAAILSKPIEDRTGEDIKRLADPPDKGTRGRSAVEAGVRCGMDISDGFLKDLNRILMASKVGARIDPDAIPIASQAVDYATESHSALKWALTGGEDFELLITVPDDIRNESLADWTIVGEITGGQDVEWTSPLPDRINPDTDGYDHFDSSVPD